MTSMFVTKAAHQQHVDCLIITLLFCGYNMPVDSARHGFVQ